MNDLLQDPRPAATVAALVALFIVSWIAAQLHRHRKSRAIFRSLHDSTRSKAVARRGFVAELLPAPEPFRCLQVHYSASSPIDLPGWILRLFGRRSRFVLTGELLSTPVSEVVWARGKTPARALGKSPGKLLWVNHRLDFLNTEYATRGVNTAAMRHAFTDMQTRFGHLLLYCRIQRGERVECEIILRSPGLDANDVAPLITTIRALGRAALRN
jgi:hypothetical protein